MALPMLRGCYRSRPPSVLIRFLKPDHVVQPQSNKTTRLAPTLSVGVASTVRSYSSDRGGGKQNQKVVVVGIPNPFIWFRTRIYYFLIRVYFDKEFKIEEFTEGSKQAFSHVSRLLSGSQFESLEGLVAKDLIAKLEEKCALLPPSHLQALSADPEDLMYTTPGDVGICYDDDVIGSRELEGEAAKGRIGFGGDQRDIPAGARATGRKFVSILMRYWYLTSARLPEESEGTRIFQVAIGGEGEPETKRLLTANYEFQREFTKGVPPDWTITRIEHSKLLD
ncbi:m-AAA protease-interacting protein 1, mitochondrial isoform X1 [Oncorhynchus keta]|uniref:m-AAA protease-interacting protein 1, mitochondrial isoform X1 n=1 Tax=Oncorhynchus keta TaxID=8018 RepID=UPI00227BE496|nr:m-AAA protease-interacting protein 1, mitochondrial isoform X1 [Oncorhynchus keta]